MQKDDPGSKAMASKHKTISWSELLSTTKPTSKKTLKELARYKPEEHYTFENSVILQSPKASIWRRQNMWLYTLERSLCWKLRRRSRGKCNRSENRVILHPSVFPQKGRLRIMTKSPMCNMKIDQLWSKSCSQYLSNVICSQFLWNSY